MLELVQIETVDYYETLAKTNYYTQDNGDPPGKWGKGAEALGLQEGQLVTNEMLQSVMTGNNPKGGLLTQNAGSENFRVGMDLVFSAPKSVSIVWANADQELRDEISKWQAEAMTTALDYLADKTETRRGHGGEVREKVGGLIYATFQHCDSREKDPQLHGHCVVSNACVRQDGTTGAIDQNGIYQHKMAMGAIYRQALAERMRGAGFKLERDENFNEIFRVAGVPTHLEKHFSKRSEAIKKIAEEKGLTGAKAKQSIAKNSRKAKGEINRVELIQRWQSESAQRGFNASSIEQIKGIEVEPFQLPKSEEMFAQLTENKSVFKEKDIDKMLAEFGQFMDIDREKMKAELLSNAECLEATNSKGERVFTSKNLSDLERGSIESAAKRKDETQHNLDAKKVDEIIKKFEAEKSTSDKPFKLKQEQREAIEHLTTNSGGVALMRGYAGAGKTTAIRAVVMAYEAAGYKVQGVAIAATAAEILKDDAGIKTDTIAKTILDLESGKQAFNAKTVLIIDEAGMLGSRDFAKLQKHMDTAGGKIIAMGDERQLQAVSAGGIFNALQVHANLPTADLKEITRQKSAAEKEASFNFSQGNAEAALRTYQDNGRVVIEKQRGDLFNKMANDYANDTSSTQEKMAITATNAEAILLNDRIRDQLKDKKQIEEAGAKFTNADGNEIEFSKGDRVLLKKNSKVLNVKNNQRGTVVEVTQTGKHRARLVLEMADGKRKTIDTNDYAHLRHGYAVTTHSSQGATVEKSFYLFNRGADLSQGYVGMTRHRDTAKIYATEADQKTMVAKFSKLNLKETTQDYKFSASASQAQQATQKAQAMPAPSQAPAVATTQAKAATQGEQGQGEVMKQAAVQKATAKIAEKSAGMSHLIQTLASGDKASQAAAAAISIGLAGVYERAEREEQTQKEMSANNKQAHKAARRNRGCEEMEL